MANIYRNSFHPEVELQPYFPSKLLAVPQAWELKLLVSNERPWLETVQPGTVARYQTLRKGLKNVTRLADKPPLQPYIIRRYGIAQGVGTLIFNQTMTHPDRGEVKGTDLDYWLSMQFKEGWDFHRGVARMLLLESQRRQENAVFATVTLDHPNPAIGFALELDKIGRPAVLSTPEPGDPYGLTKGGAQLQLYGLNQHLT